MHTSDNREFEFLVQRYREQLTKAAYHLCDNHEAASDIVQDTFLDAYRGFAKLREPEKAGAWLFAILRRKVVAYRRVKRPVAELTEEPVAYNPDSTDILVRGIVRDQMSKLAEEDREILAGKYLLGLSYQELAESLGIKEGAVRVRCFRAKERLRKALQGVGVNIPGKSER